LPLTILLTVNRKKKIFQELTFENAGYTYNGAKKPYGIADISEYLKYLSSPSCC
jgi:hypothetical protein